MADLRNKLNKLRYQTKIKTVKIDNLMREYEKVVTINAETVIPTFNPANYFQIFFTIHFI